MIRIRPIETRDAKRVSETLILSITQLCVADHHNNPETIADWTTNKTEANISTWLGDPQVSLFLAEIEGRCAGVSGLLKEGVITLNYVHPDFRFQSVSRTMLAHLEDEMKELNVGTARLSSTKTAHEFYLKAGWMDAGRSTTTDEFPMIKHLSTS